MELVDEAHLGAAHAACARLVESVAQSRPLTMTRPLVGDFEQAGDVQQRRLAGARRTNERHRLTRLELGEAPVQHVDLARALRNERVTSSSFRTVGRVRAGDASLHAHS